MEKKVKKSRKIRLFTNFQIFIVATLIALWTAFFSEDVNIYKFRSLRNELDSLTLVADSIRSQTRRDSINLDRLRNSDEHLEKYARETFYMHREDEEIYIAE